MGPLGYNGGDPGTDSQLRPSHFSLYQQHPQQHHNQLQQQQQPQQLHYQYPTQQQHILPLMPQSMQLQAGPANTNNINNNNNMGMSLEQQLKVFAWMNAATHAAANNNNGGSWEQEGELGAMQMPANAMPSIAPNMLRPNKQPMVAIGPSPTAINGNSRAQPLGNSKSSRQRSASSPNIDEGGGGGSGGSGVKFVNSTVEILQSQMRREEAPKKKRMRTTPEQLKILQRAFVSDPMPNVNARMVLAKRLGMNARAVQVWFQNRRAKEKLETKRAERTAEKAEKSEKEQRERERRDGEREREQRERRASEGAAPVMRGFDPTLFASGYTNDLSNPFKLASSSLFGDAGLYFGTEEQNEQYAQALAQYSANFELASALNVPAEGMDELMARQQQQQIQQQMQGLALSQNHQASHNSQRTMWPFPSDISGLSALGISFPREEQQQGDDDEEEETWNSALEANEEDQEGQGEEEQENTNANGMRIYSRPRASETFITGPALGQSIPMPFHNRAGLGGLKKMRSQSVPDLSIFSKPSSALDFLQDEPLLEEQEEEQDVPYFSESKRASFSHYPIAGMALSSRSGLNMNGSVASSTHLPASASVHTGTTDLQSYLDNLPFS